MPCRAPTRGPQPPTGKECRVVASDLTVAASLHNKRDLMWLGRVNRQHLPDSLSHIRLASYQGVPSLRYVVGLEGFLHRTLAIVRTGTCTSMERSGLFPGLDRDDSRTQRLIRETLSVAMESVVRPQWQSCFVEELIDLFTYWLRLLAHVVDSVASGDKRFSNIRKRRSTGSSQRLHTQPIESLDEKHKALFNQR